MPADANPNGDIFGGWVLSQMDLAGGIAAVKRARTRVATVAVDAMKFHLPVMVGDEVSCYAEIVRIGRTSMAISIETWARRASSNLTVMVTQGTFTYVAIDQNRRPTPVPPESMD
jgi:acyl-CoA thioesterase YciA